MPACVSHYAHVRACRRQYAWSTHVHVRACGRVLSSAEWAAILGLLLFAALALCVIEGASNTEEVKEKHAKPVFLKVLLHRAVSRAPLKNMAKCVQPAPGVRTRPLETPCSTREVRGLHSAFLATATFGIPLTLAVGELWCWRQASLFLRA